jgi:hypothetical protein
VRVKTIDREAKLLIQLGKMGNERNEAREAFSIATGNCVDAQQRLREARDKCYKLRRDRLAITRACKDVSEMLDKAIYALKEIAKMDTSQDASPQQCGAVLIAMNALEEIK